MPYYILNADGLVVAVAAAPVNLEEVERSGGRVVESAEIANDITLIHTVTPDGVLVYRQPVQPTLEQRWAALQSDARSALAESDITVLRCAEAGVPVPQAWRDYRAALRLIVSSAAGDPDAGLPPRPDYPPGT